VFQERRASGKHDGHRFAGASNCLTVAVTEGELLVWGGDFTALISDRYELESRVALRDVEAVWRKGKRIVFVRYLMGASEETRTWRLRLRKVESFVRAMRNEA